MLLYDIGRNIMVHQCVSVPLQHYQLHTNSMEMSQLLFCFLFFFFPLMCRFIIAFVLYKQHATHSSLRRSTIGLRVHLGRWYALKGRMKL